MEELRRLMENTSAFDRKHPILALLAMELVVWLIGGGVFFLYAQFIGPIFPGNKLVPAVLLLGLLFLVGVVGPIVMAVIVWRKDQDRAAGGGTCGY
jgi:hypothetical protein